MLCLERGFEVTSPRAAAATKVSKMHQTRVLKSLAFFDTLPWTKSCTSFFAWCIVHIIFFSSRAGEAGGRKFPKY